MEVGKQTKRGFWGEGACSSRVLLLQALQWAEVLFESHSVEVPPKGQGKTGPLVTLTQVAPLFSGNGQDFADAPGSKPLQRNVKTDEGRKLGPESQGARAGRAGAGNGVSAGG